MKSKILLMGLFLIAMLLSIGCKPINNKVANDFGWTILQSPLTGKCYEVAQRVAGYSGFMGMAEVDCSYLDQ